MRIIIVIFSIFLIIGAGHAFAETRYGTIHTTYNESDANILKNSFTYVNSDSITHTINTVYKKDTVISLSHQTKIQACSFNGTIKLYDHRSYVELILVDSNNKKYLVFDSAILKSGDSTIIGGAMETAALKHKIKIKQLEINIKNAELALSSLSYNEAAYRESIQDSDIAIKKLNERLKAVNASWTAGKNQFTNASQNFLYGHIGAGPVTKHEKDLVFGVYRASEEIPTSYDLRNLNGKDWMSPVKNQGSAGTCWAFASVGSFESYINKVYNNPDFDIDLAEAWPVYHPNGGGSESGGTSQAMSFFCSYGIMSESYFPYVVSGSYPNSKVTGKPKSGYKDDLWSATSSTYVMKDDIKAAILEYGGLYTSYTVYADFYNYSSGIYEYVSGSSKGGHAVVVMGWGENEGREYWICKNSWGNWGESGYFRIYEGECGICSSAKVMSGAVSYSGSSRISIDRKINDMKNSGGSVQQTQDKLDVYFGK